MSKQLEWMVKSVNEQLAESGSDYRVKEVEQNGQLAVDLYDIDGRYLREIEAGTTKECGDALELVVLEYAGLKI